MFSDQNGKKRSVNTGASDGFWRTVASEHQDWVHDFETIKYWFKYFEIFVLFLFYFSLCLLTLNNCIEMIVILFIKCLEAF